ADVPNVTEREAAVLRQVARGRSNAEIAGALFLTEATVKTYVSRLLTKLNLRPRTTRSPRVRIRPRPSRRPRPGRIAPPRRARRPGPCVMAARAGPYSLMTSSREPP